MNTCAHVYATYTYVCVLSLSLSLSFLNQKSHCGALQWQSFRFKCVCDTPFNHCGMASRHDLKFGQLLVCLLLLLLLALNFIQIRYFDKRWQRAIQHIQVSTTHFHNVRFNSIFFFNQFQPNVSSITDNREYIYCIFCSFCTLFFFFFFILIVASCLRRWCLY